MLSKLKDILKFSLLLICLFCVDLSFALDDSKVPTVNILTWWGYLDSTSNQLKEIEKKCHVKISYDNYYSNDQFLSRFQNKTSNYDIIIFSETLFSAVKNSINLPQSKLYKQTTYYYSAIKEHYKKSNLPHNVVYFVHSLTGFLYNKFIITPKPTDSIFTIFQKAGEHIVVMIDDPVEANFLISQLITKKTNPDNLNLVKNGYIYLTWKNFKILFQKTHVIITNSPQHIISLPNFAFTFQWSGDAIRLMQQNPKKLAFLLHPQASYISTDLLAELNIKQSTTCVAEALSSKNFIDTIQNDSFYFSPYLDCKNIKFIYFKNLCQQMKIDIVNMPWITDVSNKNFKKVENTWDYIKFNLAEKNE